MPWSQIAGDMNTYTAMAPVIGTAWLHSSKDRLGFEPWLQFRDPVCRTWIEVSFSGEILGKYDLLDRSGVCHSPAAMTSDGTVFAAAWKYKQFLGWTVLDRSDGGWHKIAGDLPGWIIGNDRENVVFSRRDDSGATLSFVPASSLAIEKVQAAELTAPRENVSISQKLVVGQR